MSMRVIATDFSNNFSTDFSNPGFSLCPLTETSFLTGSPDGFINIFDITVHGIYTLIPGRKGYWADLHPEPLLRFKGHQAGVSSLTLWNNQSFISGSYDRSICFWEREGEEYKLNQTLGSNSDAIISVSRFNINDLIALTAHGEILVWSSNSGIEPAKAIHSPIGKISAMVKINSNYFIMGGENG